MGTRVDPDLVVAALAQRRHGIVTRRELLAAGLTPKMIAARVRKRRLQPQYPGVYAVGHAQLAPRARWAAAVVAAGERAVLSHGSAAALWDLARAGGARIDVTTPQRSGRVGSPRAVRLHRCASLLATDATVLDAIPVTTPMRTLFDLAATVRERRMEDLIAQADRLALFDLRELRALLSRHPTRAGAPRLRALLDRLEGVGAAHTRSAAEVALLQLCDDHGLPAPVANAMLLGHEVDFHWPGTTLVVEIDGYQFHRTPSAFAADRARDQALTIAGFTVARFTPGQIGGSGERLRALLQRCGSTGVPQRDTSRPRGR